MDISKNILSIREAKRIKQFEIAEMLNIEPPNYSRLEKRGDKLTIEQLKQIADALGVSIFEILGVENAKKNIEESQKEIEELKEKIKFLEGFYATVKDDYWMFIVELLREEIYQIHLHNIQLVPLQPNVNKENEIVEEIGVTVKYKSEEDRKKLFLKYLNNNIFINTFLNFSSLNFMVDFDFEHHVKFWKKCLKDLDIELKRKYDFETFQRYVSEKEQKLKETN